MEFFQFARTISQLKSFREIGRGAIWLPQIPVHDPDAAIRARKIRIELHGPQEIRKSRRSAFLPLRLSPESKRLQSFERRRGFLGERHIEFLHRGERFAEFAAKFRRRRSERVQHFLLSRRAFLFLRKNVAGVAIHRFQADDKFVSDAGDRAGDIRLALRALAKFACDIGRERRIRRLRHHPKRRRHFVVGQHVQERRLAQRNAERLLQRVIEHRITGAIRKVGDEDSVSLGKHSGLVASPEPPESSGNYRDKRDRSYDCRHARARRCRGGNLTRRRPRGSARIR